MRRQLEADPERDLGVWGAEDGEIFVKLAPRMRILFNSSASHACVPHRDLLPYFTDYKAMKSKGNAYMKLCYETALEAVRADPTLMEGFAREEDAAYYHSSLIGTTTFQQRAVTHQCLRAAAVGEPSRVLRPQPHVEERELEAAEEAAVEAFTTPLSPEEAAAARRVARAAAKQAADVAMRERLSELAVGDCVLVQWEGGRTATGEVVERPTIVWPTADVQVRLRYDGLLDEAGRAVSEGYFLYERLGIMTWQKVRER